MKLMERFDQSSFNGETIHRLLFIVVDYNELMKHITINEGTEPELFEKCFQQIEATLFTGHQPEEQVSKDYLKKWHRQMLAEKIVELLQADDEKRSAA